MSRYTDTEWLIKESMPLSFSVQKWVNEVQIMTAPSIDIVRCKECKYHNTHRCFMSFSMIATEDNGYCYMGKKTDDE